MRAKGELSEYERQRLAHCQRNREYMERLGVGLGAIKELENVFGIPRTAAPSKRKKRERSEGGGGRRRSARLKGGEVEYTAEDEAGGEGKRRRRSKGPSTSGNTSRAAKHEAEAKRAREEEVMKEWLRESRKVLAMSKIESLDGEDGLHREAAIKYWGPHVVACEKDRQEAVCWQTYVESRLASPPPPSPHALLQEFYAHDAWRLLACCILMSRVSSWETKHSAIAEFFRVFPTPSDFSEQDPDLARGVMHPLGLFDNRYKALVSLTNRFLTAPKFDVGLEKENKIYGIGQFGVESYNIFCKGNIEFAANTEKALKLYCNWHAKNCRSHA
ncbi:hypothetical protein A3770_07p50060 [Chloropicon primus]|uniref:HhH-GPD domain-containing protein n=1 Tax=Chloropicon primus TaxID=1764295 RepID=A0A5B8MP85_9CHLO|nr:hypothetical protein A3770_07p50060 [Chloropicon primus]|eukprot:QDZ22488.1 hypothetical protein A3770_07p50060 [Chloropicon primus]